MIVTELTFSALPEGDVNAHWFSVAVRYKGKGRYAVTHLDAQLGRDGEWDYYGPQDEDDRDEWLAEHRFTFDEACERARAVLPTITCNGVTLDEAIRRSRQREGRNA